LAELEHEQGQSWLVEAMAWWLLVELVDGGAVGAGVAYSPQDLAILSHQHHPTHREGHHQVTLLAQHHTPPVEMSVEQVAKDAQEGHLRAADYEQEREHVAQLERQSLSWQEGHPEG
jgi:hypothetical protein